MKGGNKSNIMQRKEENNEDKLLKNKRGKYKKKTIDPQQANGTEISKQELILNMITKIGRKFGVSYDEDDLIIQKLESVNLPSKYKNLTEESIQKTVELVDLLTYIKNGNYFSHPLVTQVLDPEEKKMNKILIKMKIILKLLLKKTMMMKIL